MDVRVFDMAGAAEFLSLSRRWIRQNLGTIPHFRPSGKILFRSDELLLWLENHREKTISIDEAWKTAEALTEEAQRGPVRSKGGR